jgi:CubicO group peptidase (beta-lactamase class C family)
MIFRRMVYATATAVLVASMTAVSASAGTAPALSPGGPPTVTADDISFTHPPQTLRYGTAEQVGLVPRYIDKIATDIASGLVPSPPATSPLYPGAVALAAHDGVIVAHDAVGYARRYADATTELPPDQWIPMRRDTIFDVASVTKLFTAIAAVQLIQAGRIGLHAPVVRYIPEFAANGKSDITILNLLTHTSGLPPDPDPSLCTYANNDERWAAVYAVKPLAPPDSIFLYSDMNMMTLGRVIEAVTGQTLDRVIAQNITRPLGMTDTMFNPPSRLKPRIAAEEYQPGRGIVWGSVHDENAYCLGGVAGHAGIFSTAHDLAVLAQALLNGGRYGRARILSEDSVRELFTNYNEALPGHAHGLGFELDQRRYMGALSSPVTAGHTGFTGTSLVIDPLSHSFIILLTNRVHPVRSGPSINPMRALVATDLALAIPVRPVRGPTSWFSGVALNTTVTLSVPIAIPAAGAKLSFALWYDTDQAATGALEASSDNGATWQLVPLALRVGTYTWQTAGTFAGFEGRQWLQASTQLPGLTTNVRWSYTTNALYGRGVYVNAVRAVGPGGLIFDDSRPADAARYQPDGWIRSRT